MCCVRHYLPMLQEKKDIPVQFIYSFSLIFPLPWWLLLQTSWQMVSAQAYLDLQESFLVVISLLGSLLLKIVKAQAYLDLHGIRRSHRTSLNMLLLRKMIQADGQWWQVDSRVAVPYVQTNIMSTVSDPQQVRSISKSTISPTFLQHLRSNSPEPRSVRSSPSSCHAEARASHRAELVEPRQLGPERDKVRCDANGVVKLSLCRGCRGRCHRLHGASELQQWTYLQWTYHDQCCGWGMLGMLNDV